MKFNNPETAISFPIPPCQDDEYEETAWGIENHGEDFKRLTINRPKVGAKHVRFEMKYCGVCHSDVHLALNDLGGTMYPIVPGHELVGVVTEVGSEVTRVAVGTHVAVGCTFDSCMGCDMCEEGEENYCKNGGQTHTYNDMKKHGHIGGNLDTQTFGGYSRSQVVHERFIIILPEGMPLDRAAPIVCAGITMWDPLRHWGATKTDKKMNIGIVGVGGLGTMGIKLAAGLGHTVTAISTSNKKKELALSKGAENYVVSSDARARSQVNNLDLILNTIPVAHDIQPYIEMLGTNGTLVQLGLVGTPSPIVPFSLCMNRKSVSGSLVGGIPAVQEVIDFCFEKNIYPDTELIDTSQLGDVYDKLESGNDGGIRFVIDIEKSAAM